MIIDNSSNGKQYKEEILDFKGVWQWACPTCGAKRSFHRHGTYERNLIVLQSRSFHEEKLTILRLKCTSCAHTHAVLPHDVVPFHIYSASAMIALCAYVCLEKKSVPAVSDETGISCQLLYLFLHIFRIFTDRIHHLLRQLRIWTHSHNPSAVGILKTLHLLHPLSGFLLPYLEHYGFPLFLTRRITISYSFTVGFQTRRLPRPT